MIEYIWSCRTCDKTIASGDVEVVIAGAAWHLRNSVVCGGRDRWPFTELLAQIELWYTPD